MAQQMSPRTASAIVAAIGGAGLYKLLADGHVRVGPRHPTDPSQVVFLSWDQAPGMFLAVGGFCALFVALGLYGLWHYRRRDPAPRRRPGRR